RRIDRILRNLVVNAIEHGEGREMAITIMTSEDAVAVAVRDHGVGLRPGESSLVFNRFWRADPARARTTGGTGLGLAIALEDARLHHGWLQAWGEPGGGSQFRLTVPRNTRVELLRSPIPLEPEDSSHHLRQRRGTVAAGQRPDGSDRHTHTAAERQSSDHRTVLDPHASHEPAGHQPSVTDFDSSVGAGLGPDADPGASRADTSADSDARTSADTGASGDGDSDRVVEQDGGDAGARDVSSSDGQRVGGQA
ncbi:MAG: ATP-binding protein, partial [Actinocrinis sp.]